MAAQGALSHLGLRQPDQRKWSAFSISGRVSSNEPLLDDRPRLIGQATNGIYGREVVHEVHKRAVCASAASTCPREFVFMDRATMGLGSVFNPSEGQTELAPPVRDI